MSEPTSTFQDETIPATMAGNGEGVATEGTHAEMEKGERVLQTIMFTDIESSVNLAGTLGEDRYAAVLTRHGQLFFEALAHVRAGKIEKHTGDGFMALFDQPGEAVGVALRFQWLLRRESWGIGHPLRVRVGIHQGEILLIPAVREMPGTIGTAVNLAARVMGMADGGQVLLTRSVFDDARQFIPAIPEVPAEGQTALGWEAHGAYLVKGIEGPVEVFEVGERGHAPFRRPRNGPGAERSVSAEEEMTLGWRPAAEMEVPSRPGWRLVRALGHGGFGEVWLAENRATGNARVFKFCFDVVRLRSFKREVALFRLIREALGPRRDIATLHDVQLETSPFFLESEYCGGGTLDEWLDRKTREGGAALPQRLEIVAAIARALGAAHSLDIIHKDVKPSNVFIEELADGTVQPRLADFGIGELTDRAKTEGLDLNVTGLTITEDQTHTGTPMYRAPEYMVGSRPSVPGDIYSLGVLLYQVVVVDFHRPIGDGWRRDVPDELLAETIAACVDVQPERRISSATQVAEQLDTLDQRRADKNARDAAEQRERQLLRKLEEQRKKKQKALVITAVAVLLAAALVVVVGVLQHSRRAAITHANDIAAARYREDMIAAIASIDNWRGEAARELVNRNLPDVGGPDRRGWEWELAESALNPKPLARTVSPQPLRALAVSPDEKTAAIAGDDGELSIWSCDTLEKIHSWQVGAARSLAWKGGVLAIGLANGEVVLWEPEAKRVRRQWKAHDDAVTALGWDPKSDELTTGGADGNIAWWQSDGTPLQQFQKRGPVLALDWREDGSQIAVVLGNPTRLLAGTPDQFDHEYELSSPESAAAWRPGVAEVAISKSQDPMSSFDPYLADGSFKLRSRFSPGASAFAWAHNGERVAVGGIDGKILVLAAREPPEIVSALYGHTRRVTALHWLRRERLLSISADGTLRAWDDLQRPPHVVAADLHAPVTDAQWHPHDERLAVFIAGDEVQILDSARQTQWVRLMLPPVQGHLPFSGGRLAWSPDGHWLAAACRGRGLVVWSTQGDERFSPAGWDEAMEVRWLDDNRTLLVHTPSGWSRMQVDGHDASAVADKGTVWMGELWNGLLAKVSTREGKSYFSADGNEARSPVDIPLPAELGPIRACALNKDRTRLAIADETGAFLWLSTHNGTLSNLVRAHSSAIQAIGWHPNGTRLVTASSDGTCRVFDVTAKLVETWMVEHGLPSEIVAANWSDDGRSLMLASTGAREVKIFGIVQPSNHSREAHIASLFKLIEDHPDAEAGWQALNHELRFSEDESASIIRAAAELGAQARFTPLVHPQSPDASPVMALEGVAVPRPVQIAQACALERWDEVVVLCSTGVKSGAASWFAMAKSEALEHLGRIKESEAANMEAWRALRREHGDSSPASASVPNEEKQQFPTLVSEHSPKAPNGASTTVDLTQWTTAQLEDDWTIEDTLGNENNNLLELKKDGMPVQPDGVQFQCGNFILLGGRTNRFTAGCMLPRSTGWILLNTVSKQVSCVIAVCNTLKPDNELNTCAGEIFLLRRSGGVVRIPLVFGRNIWRWWKPMETQSFDAPPTAVAWQGSNPRARYFNQKLALYRLNWTAEAGDEPVVAISIASTMRQPAPLLMSVDARP